MIFTNNKVYDTLKYIATIVLPALLTLYGTIGLTCNIPYTAQVTVIGTAVITCMCTCLGISSKKYTNLPDDEEEIVETTEE